MEYLQPQLEFAWDCFVRRSSILIVAATAIIASQALAEDFAATVVIKDHRFEPAEIKVPAGKRIAMTVNNTDATPEEAESRDLRFEKVIGGGGKGTVRFGPLKPGRYAFHGEYHEDTAQGTVVAE
jgi:plastocyanin